MYLICLKKKTGKYLNESEIALAEASLMPVGVLGEKKKKEPRGREPRVPVRVGVFFLVVACPLSVKS